MMRRLLGFTLGILLIGSVGFGGDLLASSNLGVTSSQATASLSTYERGQLVVGCYGIIERNSETYNNGTVSLNQLAAYTVSGGGGSAPFNGAIPGSRDACLSTVKALP